jgi:hypothetical protein
VADSTSGIREFIVGTGGRSHYGFQAMPQPNSEVRNSDTYGVLKLTLHATTYDWEFLREFDPGKTFTDTGTANACHGPTQSDLDADGWLDAADNCPSDANNGQENNDRNFIDTTPPRPAGQDDITRAHSDTLGDVCDDDDDNDGLADVTETAGPPCGTATAATNPLAGDSDGDRVSDGAECALGSSPNNTASKPAFVVEPDLENDGVPDAFDPNDAATDADADGLSDRIEFRGYNTDLTQADTDNDSCGDRREAASVNADLTVNSGDLQAVAQSYGNPGAHAAMDINKDGAINSGDLQLTASAYGACP